MFARSCSYVRVRTFVFTRSCSWTSAYSFPGCCQTWPARDFKHDKEWMFVRDNFDLVLYLKSFCFLRLFTVNKFSSFRRLVMSCFESFTIRTRSHSQVPNILQFTTTQLFTSVKQAANWGPFVNFGSQHNAKWWKYRLYKSLEVINIDGVFFRL